MRDRVVDQLLLVGRLAPGELEVPGDRDVEGVAREQEDGLVAQRAVGRAGAKRLADRALVAVVAVGRGDPGDPRMAPGELVRGHDQRRRQAVADLVEPGQHHLQPGVAALRVADDQEVGARRLGELEAGEQTPPRRHPRARGQDRGRHEHRPFLDAVAELNHRPTREPVTPGAQSRSATPRRQGGIPARPPSHPAGLEIDPPDPRRPENRDCARVRPHPGSLQTVGDVPTNA